MEVAAVTCGAAVNVACPERGRGRVLAKPEPEEMNMRYVLHPVAGAPARPHARRTVQRAGRRCVHPWAAEHGDVGGRQMTCGQTANNRSVAVAQQGDLAAVSGKVLHEVPESVSALDRVAGGQDAGAECARRGVAKPGDD